MFKERDKKSPVFSYQKTGQIVLRYHLYWRKQYDHSSNASLHYSFYNGKGPAWLMRINPFTSPLEVHLQNGNPPASTLPDSL